jgi:two-component system, NarL family, sensor histidine kinase UhpB
VTLPEEYSLEYGAELDHVLKGAGEDALASVYELGRRARADGLGILDVIAFHHDATLRLLRSRHGEVDASAVIESGLRLLNEALSPFEMSFRAVDEANAALRRLNEVLEGEAKRIAHALHDQAASIVASAALELDMAVGDLPKEAREQLALVRSLLDETGEQLRHLSHELRPTILDDLGLEAALGFLAEGFERRTGVRVHVRGGVHERFPSAIETAVYRIVQEALNNAFAHGGDSLTVDVSLERHPYTVTCVVADDGSGFDVDAVMKERGKGGLGLLGMRERAHAVGGECRVRSTPGQGTTIEITVPVEAPPV